MTKADDERVDQFIVRFWNINNWIPLNEKPSDQQHLIDWFIDAMPADLQFELTQALELTHMG